MDPQRVHVWFSRCPAEEVKQEKALQVPVGVVAWGREAEGRFLCSQPEGSQVHLQEGASGLPQSNLLPKAGSAAGSDLVRVLSSLVVDTPKDGDVGVSAFSSPFLAASFTHMLVLFQGNCPGNSHPLSPTCGKSA